MLFHYFPPIFQHNIMKRRNANPATSMPTTEIKVLILLCYLILLFAMLTTIATLLAKNADNLNLSIVEYFTCEATGRSPKCDATKEAIQSLTYPETWITMVIFLGAFPGVQLLYVVTWKCLLFMSDEEALPLHKP